MLVVWCGGVGGGLGGGGGACALSRRCHRGDIRLGEGSICGRGNELAGKQENGACKNWSCWDSSSLGEYDEVSCERGRVPIFEHGLCSKHACLL